MFYSLSVPARAASLTVPSRPQSCERRPCPGTGVYPPSPTNSSAWGGTLRDALTPDTRPNWDVGPWDQCSTDCGVGTRSETLEERIDPVNILPKDSFPKCNLYYLWRTKIGFLILSLYYVLRLYVSTSQFNPMFTTTQLFRSRPVQCLKSGALVPETFCLSAAGMRPVTQQLCDLGSCSPTTWYSGDWGNTVGEAFGVGSKRWVTPSVLGEHNG